MSEDLIKTQQEDNLQSEENMKIEKRVMKLSLVGSILFILVEVFIAIYTHSHAVLMDCVYDLTDLLMLGPLYLLIPHLYKPVTERHPYGFAQVESLFIIIKTGILIFITGQLILESIQDPGNLGTMVRTGEGAGITGVIMNKTTVDLFNPKTIRSTMGSIYRVPFYVAEDLAETLDSLKKQGVALYAAHLKGEHAYDEEDYTGACGFLIGNEGNGLSDTIANLADTYIKIPMEGQVESLNAAISASLLMYEANRQRRK